MAIASTAWVAPAASAASVWLTPSGSIEALPAHDTPQLKDIAADRTHSDMLAALGSTRMLELPAHLYPDGSPTGNARRLPQMTQPTVGLSAAAAHPSTRSGTITGFTGLTDRVNAATIGGEVESPDLGLAVYDNKVLEVVNNALQVFSANGTALASPVATATFFGTRANDNLIDPHAVFDPASGRWFIEELMYSSSFNGFAVAVSKTSDPLGAYHVYFVDADTSKMSACAGSCRPDYPQIGLDKYGVYITANLFSNTTGKFVSAAIYALPKAALEAGAPISYPYFRTQDFVVQPAIAAPGTAFETAANGTEYLMSARNIFDGSSNLRVYALSNTRDLQTSPNSVTLSFVDVAAESYNSTVPSRQPDRVGSYGKSQGATHSPRLDGGYNAFGGGVKYANGNLYAALTMAAKDATGVARNVVAYFVVQPSRLDGGLSASITSQGYVVLPNGYSLSLPALAIDKAGNGVIGTTITNPNATIVGGFPSAGFVELRSNAISGNYVVTGAGKATDDGFTGYNGSVASIARWGDFASAVVDAKTGAYWLANEYIPNPNRYLRGPGANWGTFITQIH